jgi:hypothetical protein
MVSEWGVSGNLLHGENLVPSPNPRGDDVSQILCEHILRSLGSTTLATDHITSYR